MIHEILEFILKNRGKHCFCDQSIFTIRDRIMSYANNRNCIIACYPDGAICGIVLFLVGKDVTTIHHCITTDRGAFKIFFKLYHEWYPDGPKKINYFRHKKSLEHTFNLNKVEALICKN